jgi:hypothetical protein
MFPAYRAKATSVTTKNNRVNKEATMWNRTTVFYSSSLKPIFKDSIHVLV